MSVALGLILMTPPYDDGAGPQFVRPTTMKKCKRFTPTPNAVRVKLAENDTVYVPDSERDDFTVETAPPCWIR